MRGASPRQDNVPVIIPAQPPHFDGHPPLTFPHRLAFLVCFSFLLFVFLSLPHRRRGLALPADGHAAGASCRPGAPSLTQCHCVRMLRDQSNDQETNDHNTSKTVTFPSLTGTAVAAVHHVPSSCSSHSLPPSPHHCLSHCHSRVPSSPAAVRMVCAHPARLCACVSVRVAGEVDMSLDDGSLEASSISLVKSLG